MFRAKSFICHELLNFQKTRLDAVRRAFRRTSCCPLHQAWLAKAESRFAPGVVWFGWRKERLLALAELTDADLFTRATAPNQRLWELGDAFEIFLQPAGRKSYFEFQVAPNNQRLQLRFPNTAAVIRARKTGCFTEALLPPGSFRSKTWVKRNQRRWFVYAEIPAPLLWEKQKTLNGSTWRFSFGRYDYTRGCDTSVISSTSPHKKPDFHRRREWGTLRCSCGLNQGK